ncbi:LysR family transcriptional regulator [Marinobacterium lutimaris]|nr:LysR family transcriptional regulator [Marinobacterium lutimaris]
MPSLRRQIPSANALFVFESAARCGNFTKAAAEMGVTQPAVSRMLSLLEEHLQVKLFERSAGRTLLTEEGEILYRGVKDGFQRIESSLQEIAARRSGMETVTLSVSTAFTTHWLMPRMHRLQTQLPNVDIRFQLMSGAISGSVEDVDFGMRFMSGEDLSQGAELLIPELLVLVCSPEYKDTHFTAQGEPPTYIGLTDNRTNWLDYFSSVDCPTSALHSLEFTDYAVVLQAALLGQGFAVGWMNIVSNWLCNGALVPVNSELVATGRLCHITFPRTKPLSPAARRVKDWIIAETHADIALLNERFPELNITETCRRHNLDLS